MESTQFDTVVRDLVDVMSRRDITRAGLGALGAAALSAVGLSALLGDTVTAMGKKGKGKGGGKGKGKGKSKGKGKGPGTCAASKQGVGFTEGCDDPGDKCASDEDRAHGQEHAAQCTTSSNNVCELVPDADGCRATLVPCCSFHATCDPGSFATCRDAAYRAFPELCEFIFLPVCTSPE
jgi:hypothetical protein